MKFFDKLFFIYLSNLISFLYIYKRIYLFFILFPFLSVYSQTPTVQDCPGAIAICQNVYHETNAYTGIGNYTNEIDTAFSCTDGEKYSVWYTFTAQTSGNFSFILTPNNNNNTDTVDDYDWTIFDLTHASCAEILTNPKLEISCNSFGDSFGKNGPTGASSAQGGTDNNNGPGDTNGPPWNADIPVKAGNIYVMMVSNWSQSTYGYTIDFSSSTAQIFDNVTPFIQQINSPTPFGINAINFSFSENILCNTIAPCDLMLTGPGGPYTITGVNGVSCTSGGTQEKTFTLTFSPAITKCGTYSLNLDANACNSVTDLCGNVAPSGSLPFTVNSLLTATSTTPTICNAKNGTANVTINGGTGNFSYQWNTQPPQNTATAVNLSAGTYIVTITEGICQEVDTAKVIQISNLSASISNITNTNCGQSDGSASVYVNSGTQPYTYSWNTSPLQQTATANNLPAGSYSVLVSDINGCSISFSATIHNSNMPEATVSFVDAHCNQSDGSALVVASGGSGKYTYSWSTGDTTTSIQQLSPGLYTVTVDDGFCDDIATITIYNIDGVQANFSYHPNPITISNPNVTFTSESLGANTWQWDFGDNTGNLYSETVVHSFDTIGNYSVLLIVSDSFGCIDSIIKIIEIVDKYTIYIPNSFTPNNNGINDFFQAIGNSWEEGSYEMTIYNRWGNIIFETKDPQNPWNGSLNNESNQMVAPDIYVYQIKVKGINSKEKIFVGTVTLLK